MISLQNRIYKEDHLFRLILTTAAVVFATTAGPVNKLEERAICKTLRKTFQELSGFFQPPA
eukprot:140361-Hanusia_phi.AAC.3